jgi:hypothetical protein
MDPELLREAKALAAQDGTTLTALLEEGLRDQVRRRRRAPKRLKLVRVDGELQPGIDITDRATLLGLMNEDREATRTGPLACGRAV